MWAPRERTISLAPFDSMRTFRLPRPRLPSANFRATPRVFRRWPAPFVAAAGSSEHRDRVTWEPGKPMIAVLLSPKPNRRGDRPRDRTLLNHLGLARARGPHPGGIPTARIAANDNWADSNRLDRKTALSGGRVGIGDRPNFGPVFTAVVAGRDGATGPPSSKLRLNQAPIPLANISTEARSAVPAKS